MPDMPVALTTYDPSWPERFAEQESALATLLAPWLAGPVQHIGSTAVPGMSAKPVIDILVPVASLAEATVVVPVLSQSGWLFWADDPCRDYRLWFLRPSPQSRTHHLQVIQHDDPHALAVVAFRDALRADPTLRREYAELKEQLSRQHQDNRNAYTNAKDAFVAQVIAAAGLEVPVRYALPE